MENKLTCDVVKDLIPLYSGGLCSEESRAAVDAHAAECESCRKLLEMPLEQEITAAAPDEKNVFKKLNRRMRRGKIWIIVLCVVLLLVLGAVGFLSVGQIVKGSKMISFETIVQSAEVKQLAQHLADGDYRGYVDLIYDGSTQSLYDSDKYEKIQQKNAALLAEAFGKALGGRKVTGISAHSEYSRWDESARYLIYTWCTLKCNDGAEIEIAFVKGLDNRFMGDIASAKGIEDYIALSDCFQMINNMADIDNSMKTIMERAIQLEIPPDEDIDRRADFVARYFAAEYREEIKQALSEFYAKGYTVTYCTVGDDKYDDNAERYFDLWLSVSDGQGEATLHAKIYRDSGGMKKPEVVGVSSANDCSEELIQSLEMMFG